MADVTTQGVLKPSAGTYLYGFGTFWVSLTDTQATVHGTGYAYSDASIQNGVRCQGNIGTSVFSDAGAGVTNRGDHIAAWSMSRTYDRGAYDASAIVGVRIWGEPVGGWNGYNNGSTSGSQAAPLAYAQGEVAIPALATVAVPPAPDVSGPGDSPSVTVAAVAGAVAYRLAWSEAGSGTWTDYGQVSPGVPYTMSFLPNRAYVLRASAQAPGGAWTDGVVSDTYYTTPAPPSGLSANVTGTGTTVRLTWLDNALATSTVELERADDGAFTSGVVTVYSGPPVPLFTDTVVNGPEYFYRVRCHAAGGTTEWSATAQAATLLPPNAVYSFYRNPPADAADADVFRLTWHSNDTGARPYATIRVQVSHDMLSWDDAAVIDGTYTSYEHQGAPNDRLFFRVRPENAAGPGDWEAAGPLMANAAAPAVIGTDFEPPYTVFKAAADVPWAASDVSVEVQVSSSPDGGASGWSVWTTISSTEASPGIWQAQKYSGSYETVRYRARTWLVWDDDPNEHVQRLSEWAETGVTEAGLAPPAPVLSFDEETLTATVHAGPYPVGLYTVRLYVDGVGHGPYHIGAGGDDIQVAGLATSSRFTLTASASSAQWWPFDVWAQPLEVSLGQASVSVGNVPCTVAVVYEDGTVVPAAVGIVRP
jgi:hypothetical protein